MKTPFEIEFKYNADSISLVRFHEFCAEREPVKYLHASGFDYFYERVKEPGSFCRHRVGPDSNQLTFKRKLDDKNNYIRTEHNLDLGPAVTVPQVAALCSEFGYDPNFSLFKNCFIYCYDYYTLVYYICSDLDMKELGRFVEIEMREDHDWRNEQEAMDALLAMERFCKPLGITPQARVKRSLFEMFRHG